MKRSTLWWPIMLGGLVLGLKWHLDHPTPTKLDRETRLLFFTPCVGNMNYVPRPPMEENPNAYDWPLSRQESKVFAESLFLLPQKSRPSPVHMGKHGIARFSWFFTSSGKNGMKRMTVFINPGESDNKLVMDYEKWQVEYKLHPATVKHWMSFLLAHPRYGPELRARMNS